LGSSLAITHSLVLASWMSNPLNWVLMALGIGLIIFVHELGHFLVAKACGVKCEKFYLGFDIAGWKICSFRWGETEYGIGILPLGGYVKMLGQDDNPARAQEEAERTKLKNRVAAEAAAEAGANPETADATAREEALQEGTSAESSSDGKTVEANDQGERLDPRSYTAKSVPQRMAIISAGVVMNVIFAFVFATIAYLIGVKYMPPVVGRVGAGSPAWEANLPQGGEIQRVGDAPTERFGDVARRIAFQGKQGQELPLTVLPPGKKPGETEIIRVTPVQLGDLPFVGILPSAETVVVKVREGSPAAQAGFVPADNDEGMPGDRIISVNGQSVSTFPELNQALSRDPTRPVTVTVERAITKDGKQTEEKELTIGPKPMREIGLVMEMGRIVGVQKGSLAEQVAGLQKGDVLLKINMDARVDTPEVPESDGPPPGDPMTLPERLRRLADDAPPGVDRYVMLTFKRDEKTIREVVPLQRDAGYVAPSGSSLADPIVAPSLGIAYEVLSRVASVEKGSPADKAGMQAGDSITNVKLVPGEDDDSVDREREMFTLRTLSFSPDADVEDRISWPTLMYQLQHILPDTQVRLSVERSGSDHPLELTMAAVDSSDFYHPERGLALKSLVRVQKADSLGQAMSLGLSETWTSLTMVFTTLKKLVTGELSVKLMGGPGAIAAMAGSSADQGIAELLIFMTIISANLAVINFLPIPVLDGGHMVFLLAEAIRRKPVSERVLIPVTYAGLFFILGLFIFVTTMDVGRLFSWMGEQFSR